MRALFCVGLVALALGACDPVPATAAPGAGKGDEVVNFDSQDAQMNAAIASARKALPVFWSHLKAHPEMTHSLKVSLPTPHGGHEHIWISDFEPKGGDKFTGLLANDPDDLPDLKLGSPVTFDEAQISDWGYVKGDKLYGHYTTRIVIQHMDPAEAAPVRAMLSENPVETSGQ